jgi:LacI family transcriptional regulator, repressor for deo operon, udp, cdd, tsx, nupC, and nupG
MAFGVLKVLGRLGLRVPEDVSVVGFDDHEMAAFFDLTTIAQPVYEQGRLIAKTIVEEIANPGQVPPSRLQAGTSLIVRGTTSVPGLRRMAGSQAAVPPSARPGQAGWQSEAGQPPGATSAEAASGDA